MSGELLSQSHDVVSEGKLEAKRAMLAAAVEGLIYIDSGDGSEEHPFENTTIGSSVSHFVDECTRLSYAYDIPVWVKVQKIPVLIDGTNMTVTSSEAPEWVTRLVKGVFEEMEKSKISQKEKPKDLSSKIAELRNLVAAFMRGE